MREKVVIVGGGISGLTAAHELVERGFEVHLYERRTFLGGKAASTQIKVGPDENLPAEHGYRFFPGWYRHLPDTLQRIPYRGKQKTNAKSTVYDNLISIDKNQLDWSNRPPINLPLRVPRSLDDLGTLAATWMSIKGIGLTSDEVALFAGKLSHVAMMTDEQRLAELEGLTWWDYLECDSNKTEAYRSLVQATTRTSIAAKATEVSAYTIGRLAIRSLTDALAGVDRVLNGPTSEVWLDPWRRFLEGCGVTFHCGYDLDAITFSGDRPEIESIDFVPVELSLLRRLRRILARRLEHGSSHSAKKKDEEDVETLTKIRAQLLKSDLEDPALAGISPLLSALDSWPPRTEAETSQVKSLVGAIRELEHTRALRTVRGEGVHFIFALPLEQLAYFVARSPMAITIDPELGNLVKLSANLDWMAGIQFYLKTPARLPIGHIVGVKTPWALTAIEQTQHWKDVKLPDDVQSIISVDISMWKEKGEYVKKEAFNCLDRELAIEVWEQLKALVNRNEGPKILRDEMLRGRPSLTANVNFRVDDNIIDLLDRKKQAAYERVRALAFSEADVLGSGDFADSYMWGPRARFNAEPLLINRPGTASLRPAATTEVRNMFIAGDFVKTESDLACMEGANEAGRRAVNAFLDAVGAKDERCRLWGFSISQDAWDALARQTSVSVAVAAVAATRGALASMKDRVFGSIGKAIVEQRSRRLP